MLTNLQASLQQYMNWELPDVQVGYRKGRRARDQIANIHWEIGRASCRERKALLYTLMFSQIKSTKDKLRSFIGKISFQSQRRAMPENVQTTTQWCSFGLLARLCSKSFKLGFSSIWTKNFQMCKLRLEKTKEPEITLPTPGSWRR